MDNKAKAKSIAAEFEADDLCCDLNGLVREAAVKMADRITEAGVEAQIEFLLAQGFTPEEIQNARGRCDRCGQTIDKVGLAVDYRCEWICEACFDAVVLYQE